MSVRVAGFGWVTPLGADLDTAWERMMRGEVAVAQELLNPETGRAHPCLPVPANLVERLARHPRLRRSSAISLFAATAGLAALERAGFAVTPELAARTAVVFAVASGGVVYTRRFYDGIVKSGAGAASPLLFPETVYNAPASHLAALLGIDGASYTLVGDASVGLAALGFAEQLLATDANIDQCVVVGAEEVDWVLCEGYRDWRLATGRPRAELYSTRPHGFLLGEGAAALVLSRTCGEAVLCAVHPGIAFTSRKEAGVAIDRVCRELSANLVEGCVIGSANGSFVDALEAAALAAHRPEAPVFCPKSMLGEALGAGALMGVVAGLLALERGELPPTPGAGSRAPRGLAGTALRCGAFRSALILATGLNQQASGVVVERAA